MALNVSGSTTTQTTAPNSTTAPAPTATPATTAATSSTPTSTDSFTPAQPTTSPVALTPPAPAEDAAATTPPATTAPATTAPAAGDSSTAPAAAPTTGDGSTAPATAPTTGDGSTAPATTTAPATGTTAAPTTGSGTGQGTAGTTAAPTPPAQEGVSFTDATVGDDDQDKFAFGRQDVPVIDQRHPNGISDKYLNGNWNCGPAVIAMVARSLGPDATMTDSAGQLRKIADMDDATLVSELGKISGTTQQNGTSFKGMRAAAAAIGEPADASELWWSKNGEAKPLGDDFVDSGLKAGKPIVINGAIDLPGTGSKPLDHYLLITGKTQGGDYIVNDPWTAKQHIMSKADLKEFLIDNSVHDGVAIQVG